MTIRKRSGTFLVLTLLGWHWTLSAQNSLAPVSPSRGFDPNSVYAAGEIDSLDMSSGSISLVVPIVSLAPGRAGLSASLNAVYSSRYWETDPERTGDDLHNREYHLTQALSQGGWEYGFDYELVLGTDEVIGGLPCGQVPLRIIFPDKSRHALFASGSTNCGSTNSIWYSLDGSFLRLQLRYSVYGSLTAWTLFLPDGSRVDADYTGASFADTAPNYMVYETLKDRNGNQIEFARSNYGETYIRDAEHRLIVLNRGNASVHYISAPGPNGGTLQWTVNWTGANQPSASYRFTSRVPAPAPEIMQDAGPQISSIVLPNGRQYSFSYGATYGEISSFTTPLGATTTYSYALDGSNGSPSWPLWMDLFFSGPISKTVTYANQYDGGPTHENWTYSFPLGPAPAGGNATTSVTAPDGGTTSFTFVTLTFAGPVYQNEGLISKIVKPDGSVVERNWQANIPQRATLDGNTPDSFDPPYGTLANAWVAEELTSEANASGTPTITTSTQVGHDQNGNTTSQASFGYVAYGSLHSGGNPLFLGSVGPLLHKTDTTMKFPAAMGASSANAYTETTAPLFQLPQTVTDGNGLQTNSYVFDSPGNMLSETTGGITVSHGYDSSGNRTSDTDANLVQTKYTYDDVSAAISCPVGAVTNLYPTKVTRAPGTSVEQSTNYTYDCNNGQVVTSTDPNNVQTTNTYTSASPWFGRLVSASVGGLLTQYAYDDTNRTVQVKRDVATLGGGQSISLNSYDQLGRPWQTQQFENPGDASDITKGIKVQTRYIFNGGKYKLVTNPFRATSPAASTEDTMGWTATGYDTSGREKTTTHYSGGGAPNVWPGGSNFTTTGQAMNAYDTYSGGTNFWRTVTATDEASKSRLMRYDAVSRLAQVYEDPPASGLQYLTCYGYDALDDLTSAQQQGTTTATACSSPLESRSFHYDVLRRLQDATNPESGTIHYFYDGNGNLTSRTDGNSVTTTLQYDKLNRLADKHYSANSPGDSVFCYDGDTATTHGGLPDWSCAGAPSGGTNLKGHMTMAGNPSSKTTYSNYDAWGRPLNSTQTTAGVDYPFSYTYDAAGDVKTEQYPTTGRTLSYGYDAIGRVSTVSAGVTPYASVLTYAAQGSIQKMIVGDEVEQHCFNARLLPVTIRQGGSTSTCEGVGADALRLDYGYDAVTNGNVASETIHRGVAAPFSQVYMYDKANRLHTMTETGAGPSVSQTYDYDYAGNRWVSANSGFGLSANTPTANSVFPDSTNRMYVNGAGYYPGGNQQQIGGYAFTYDGENKLLTSTLGAAVSSYTYDGAGRRVTKVSGGTTTVFVYDATGFLAQEYASGMPPPTPPCSTCYLMADHLGSTRLMTDGNGIVMAKHDYLPFGEEMGAAVDGRDSTWGGSEPRQEFTSKERDAESGLDYFGARYLSSAQGRFTSADLPANYLVSLPQSWNKYTYALNNPLAIVDPDGQFPKWIHEWIIDQISGLSENDKSVLKAASADADSFLKGGQNPSRAFTHAMLDGLAFKSAQTDPEHAANFVEDQLRKAIGIQAAYARSHRNQPPSFSPDALYAMGLAIHTVTDSASRYHNGVSSYWYGGLSLMDYFHSAAEPLFYAMGGGKDKDEGRQRAEVTTRIIFQPSAIDQVIGKIRGWFHLKPKDEAGQP